MHEGGPVPVHEEAMHEGCPVRGDVMHEGKVRAWCARRLVHEGW